MKTLNIKEIYAVSGAGLSLVFPPLRLPIKNLPPISTLAVGEEDGSLKPCKPRFTTLALGEEGDHTTSINTTNEKLSPFGDF